MGKKVQKIFKSAEVSFQNPSHKRRWQGGVGIAVMALFVVASFFFNQTVQALNQVAGSYGYYGSQTYGYVSATISSDSIPAAVTAVSVGAKTTTTLPVSWTAPTLTANGTAIASSTGGAEAGSVASYNVAYSTSTISGSVCSEVSGATTSSTASHTFSGLTAGTTYYICISANDGNGVEGLIKTAQLSTPASASSSGGGGGGGGGTAGSVNASVSGASGAGSLGVSGSSGAGSLGASIASNIQALSATQLGNRGAVAASVGASEAAVSEKAVFAEEAVVAASFNGTLTGAGRTALVNAVAAVAATNPFYANDSSNARVKSFVRNLGNIYSGSTFAAMNSDETVLIDLVKVVSSNMNGDAVTRDATLNQLVNNDLESREDQGVGAALLVASVLGLDVDDDVVDSSGVSPRERVFSMVRRQAQALRPRSNVDLDAEKFAAMVVALAFNNAHPLWLAAEGAVGGQISTVVEFGIGQNAFATTAARDAAADGYQEWAGWIASIGYSPYYVQYDLAVTGSCFTDRGCEGANLGVKSRNTCKAAVAGEGSWLGPNPNPPPDTTCYNL